MTAGKPAIVGFLHFQRTGEILPVVLESEGDSEGGASLTLRDGVFTLRAPGRLAAAYLQSLPRNPSWTRQGMRVRLLAAAPGDGSQLPYRGEVLTLRYVTAKPGMRPKVRRIGETLEVALPPLEGTVACHSARKQVIAAWYRAEAANLLLPGAARLAEQTGLRPSQVLVRTQYSRWGSCTADGTIRLSSRLVMLPPRWAEFVIIHELVHLEHRNHGPGFWGAFDAIVPGARAHAKQFTELSRGLPDLR